MKPPRSILNKSFPYVPAHATDVRATFERIRRELERAEQKRLENEAEARTKTIAWRKR